MTKQADLIVSQSVAILVDGNNIERSIHELTRDKGAMISAKAYTFRIN